ncbi:DNA-binding transcriptional MerR regulator [Spinactinospora alkalitolerans]|uniref:DNA-binding transcriptional MerR regulator n=1 Tax=Spinactinospora alkalitolerans TaxID=687207 RepID=A0A852TTV6_9ACTN|nr:MerR family transcriptional regulator [Spinactinospora alkalitolerans]NYE47368.1 DNA-binding transcriptional MerR regulator [Spinactinospora alkalitolerans]
MVLMRVSELAERSGVAATTLRYYEERGLLPAQRSPAGYRLYDERALDRLAFITTAKRLGLDLDEIGELTALWAAHPCARIKAALAPRLEQRLDQARTRAAELADFQALLRTARTRLQQLPDRDAPCDPGCAFLADLAPPDRKGHPRALPMAATGGATCLLEAGEHERRLDAWRELLAQAASTPRAHGSSWSLPLDKAGRLAELAAAEQQCCAFLDLRIDFTPQRVHLHVGVHPDHRPDPDSPAGQAARLLGALDPVKEN